MKFQNSDFDQNKITTYLFDLGFNVYQKSGKLKNPNKEIIFFDRKNQHETYFVGDNLYWEGSPKFSTYDKKRY